MATPIPQNRAAFALTAIMACTGGRLRGAIADGALTISGVSSDTRALRGGEAFVALVGERFDGHAHLAEALERGAVLAIVEREMTAPPGLTMLKVPSTLEALGAIAAKHLARWRGAGDKRVLALTGSAGKTTTKCAIAALMDAARPVQTLATAGNLNNLVGVPMMLLGLDAAQRFAVLELGTNAPGEIGALSRMVRPDVGLLTLIAAAHTEGLAGIDGVAREKTALFDELSSSGDVAIGNADDPLVFAALTRSHAGRRIGYGEHEDADYRIVSREVIGASQQRLRIRAAERELEVETPLLGRAGALATAAAIAAVETLTGDALGPELVTHALEATGPTSGRMQPRRTSSGLYLIDDSYNANPASCRASIEAAAEIARAEGRPLSLVLGAMRELGTLSQAAHEELGELCADAGARLLIAVGDEARVTAQRAGRGGVVTHHADTSDEAVAIARREIDAGDVVLVKGSRGVHTERIVEALLESFDAGASAPSPHDRCSAGGAP